MLTSMKAGEVHKFSGTEQPAKDVECILIYDEETGVSCAAILFISRRLIFLISNIRLKSSIHPFSSSMMAKDVCGEYYTPICSYNSAYINIVEPASVNKGKARQGDSETSSPFEDNIKVEDETNLEEIMQQAVALRREEEEEEGEEVDPPPPPSPISPPKPARPVKSLPKARAELPPKIQMPPPLTAPPPPATKTAPVKAKKSKPAPPVPISTSASYPDEEVIEFGKAAKRARPDPPRQAPPPPRAASPVSLSLPGGSTPVFAPPPAPMVPKSTVSRNIPPPAQPPPIEVPASPPPMAQSDSDDDEEDWEQVPTAIPVIPQQDYEAQLEEDIFGDGFAEGTEDADGGEDIDANDFEQMMNEQMEPDSEDDFLAAAVSPEPTRQPISLNRLASGGAVGDSDEDDFSSSDESD